MWEDDHKKENEIQSCGQISKFLSTTSDLVSLSVLLFGNWRHIQTKETFSGCIIMFFIENREKYKIALLSLSNTQSTFFMASVWLASHGSCKEQMKMYIKMPQNL